MPVIAAMWHGQHFMIHFAKRPQDRAASLVSRSGDGEFNAIALRHLGVRAIRGSGARGRDIRKKGGVQALRGMLRALSDGEMVVMTADIPKISRVCGLGIVTLAQLSGRPIVPVAVVTSRRIDFNSWDRASIGLPFGRGAIVLGEPVHVPREADDDGARRLCARASSGSSTGCTSAPMPLSDRRIRAQSPRTPAPSLTGAQEASPRMSLPLLFRAYRTGDRRCSSRPCSAFSIGASARAARTRRASASGRAIPAGSARKGHLIWVHGASIGETLSLLPVVERTDPARPRRSSSPPARGPRPP